MTAQLTGPMAITECVKPLVPDPSINTTCDSNAVDHGCLLSMNCVFLNYFP